jgi:hypothetical protein
MKKFAVLTLAALMVAAFAIPATALENQFGGYFDVRAFTQQNFTGEDETEDMDVTMVDSRTRIYYTAKINDNLKLVNKFEFDTVWGGPGYGNIGADGVDVEIKNTYADFTLGSINAKIGTQPGFLARGFLFDDDFSGATITFNGETLSIPFIWMKAYEGGAGKDENNNDYNDYDADYYGLAPSFNLREMLTINPYFLYVTSENASAWFGEPYGYLFDDFDTYYFGIDVDAKFEMGNVWFTGIYQFGEMDVLNESTNNYESLDISAWLLAIGGNMTVSDNANVHGQFFYATGDDDDDNDLEVFFGPQGQSYYWAEIMGLGMFDGARDGNYDYATSNNSPGEYISNIMAANIGASFSPMEKLNVGLDLWYAALAEDDANGESDLGTEVDLKLTYELVEGLNLDVVGAYLFAGDATYKGDNDADPYEVGTQLSLSF